MAKITARSGWTNIRICNDCKQTIEAGDRCGCPTVTPYLKGVEVTLLDDGVPFELGVVARVGNGAWRLGHRALWFRHDGSIVDPSNAAEKRYSVRPSQPEDKPAIMTNKDMIRLRETVATYRDWATKHHRSAVDAMNKAERCNKEAASHENSAALIVPAERGDREAEKARAWGINEALKDIQWHLQHAAVLKEEAIKAARAAGQHEGHAQEAREKSAKAKADLEALLATLAQPSQQGSNDSGAA